MITFPHPSRFSLHPALLACRLPILQVSNALSMVPLSCMQSIGGVERCRVGIAPGVEAPSDWTHLSPHSTSIGVDTV